MAEAEASAKVAVTDKTSQTDDDGGGSLAMLALKVVLVGGVLCGVRHKCAAGGGGAKYAPLPTRDNP
jgi:hypothetical protein